MRVIAGAARGMKLKMASNGAVRPTTDRIKESLFNVIGPFFDGGNVLDLFAGTGALGIEALSRGMENGIFVDKSYQCTRIIKENLKNTRLDAKGEVFCSDALAVLKKLDERNIRFNLIFLDPPYYKSLLDEMIAYISHGDLLLDHGILVTEHPKDVKVLETVRSISMTRQMDYGNIKMSLYRRKE